MIIHHSLTVTIALVAIGAALVALDYALDYVARRRRERHAEPIVARDVNTNDRDELDDELAA